jgi:1-acyl-sn-glycerol-3-phosphate acyltransferase
VAGGGPEEAQGSRAAPAAGQFRLLTGERFAPATEAPEAPEVRPLPTLPGAPIHPVRRAIRYWISRTIAWVVVRAYVRPRLVHGERLPGGPAIYCLNHLNWADPFVVLAILPARPRIYFFGPKEEDMASGGRNRLMSWTRSTVPYRPGKNDLLGATRRVSAVLASGAVLATFGEGRIHASERELLPLQEGPAYFAIRAKVPLVPIAIRGTSWLRLGRRVTVTIGEPITASGRANRTEVDRLTRECWTALHALVVDAADGPPPGRFGRWITEVFNDWPEGERPSVDASPETT